MVNLFIVYELDTSSRDLTTDFSLEDCLFGAVKLTKNADPAKHLSNGYGFGFDLRSEFSSPDGSTSENVIISGFDMNSSVHIDNKKSYINSCIGPTQGLDDTMLATEAQYLINFSISNIKFCSSLHYNGSNSFLFVNATKTYQFKANDLEIKIYPLCLENISKHFTANKMKKTGLNGYDYKFSVGYNIINTNNIINIHKYLMKTHDVKQCLELFLKIYCIIK